MSERQEITVMHESAGKRRTIGHLVLETTHWDAAAIATSVSQLHGKLWVVEVKQCNTVKKLVGLLRDGPIQPGETLGVMRLLCFEQEIYLFYKV